MDFTGNMVALVTPFRNGSLDLEAMAGLIDRMLSGDVSALVPCGTTGESPSLSHAEHDRVIAFVAEVAGGKIPIIAGAGSNATDEAIRLTKAAEKAGAQAVLSVNPYYNRPSQAGLIRHFSKVADCSSLPVVLYNIPARTGVSLSIDSIAELAQHPNIQAIKDATGNVNGITATRERTDLAILSGDDSLTLPMMALGACGVISVLSNLLPREMSKLVQASLANDFQIARRLHDKLHPLMMAMGLETNPLPIKTALAMQGRICEEFRLPLCPMAEGNRETLSRALAPYADELDG